MLDQSTLEIVALAGLGVGVLGTALAAAALAGLRRLAAALGSPASPNAGERPESGPPDSAGLAAQIAVLRAEVADLRAATDDAVRHVAVLRYDAFEDMGGRLSFSAALLDDAGDGLVLTSISGRREARTYAKGITAGESEQPLSPEEAQVVASARRSAAERAERRRGALAPDGRHGARRAEPAEL